MQKKRLAGGLRLCRGAPHGVRPVERSRGQLTLAVARPGSEMISPRARIALHHLDDPEMRRVRPAGTASTTSSAESSFCPGVITRPERQSGQAWTSPASADAGDGSANASPVTSLAV